MDVMEAIRTRRSVREYRPDPVPEGTLDRLMEALRLAPSACNNQPWRFVIVTEPGLRKKLASASQGQMFIAEAPVIVVGCALPKRAYRWMGGHWNSADVDVAIALDHLTLAAASEGLGTCWIGAFDEKAVKELLGIPEQAKVVALTPVGRPRNEGLLRPARDGERKAPQEVIGRDKY